MAYKLYLDDIRNPDQPCEWVICRTVGEAIKTINANGLPELISFDHDLGDGQADAIELAKWLVHEHLDGQLDISSGVFKWRVHSMNPIGRQNIEGLLLSFQRHLEKSKRKEKGEDNASKTYD